MKFLLHNIQRGTSTFIFNDGGKQLDMFGGNGAELSLAPGTICGIEGVIADIDNASVEKIDAALQVVQAHLRTLRNYDRLCDDPASSYQTGAEPSAVESYLSTNGGIKRINQLRKNLMSLRAQEKTLRTKAEALKLTETA